LYPAGRGHCYCNDSAEPGKKEEFKRMSRFQNLSFFGILYLKEMYMKMKIGAAVLMFLAAALASAQNGLNTVKPVISDRDLVINVDEVTENAIFYPVDIGGTRVEVLAVKAPDGTIRTAFNTCQSCYSSGRGFYKQQGTVLVCQNCGKRFRMSQVEVRSGGCNPVPIFKDDKTVSGNTITISKEYLARARDIFARWKRS
jgi:uncharacterized membrane protein